VNLAFVVAIVAAIAGPLGVYLVAVRRLSGKVSHSAASDLWAESAAIRKDYQLRISELNTVVLRLEATISELRIQVIKISEENFRFRRDRIARGLAELEGTEE
jgi:hypothetical protein